MNRERLKLTVNAAILLLEKLEAALDAGDNRQIGARLYELRRELHILRSEIEDGSRDLTAWRDE